jgi:hypothetical protein
MELYPNNHVRRHILKTLATLYTLAGYFNMDDVQIAIRTCQIRIDAAVRPVNKHKFAHETK